MRRRGRSSICACIRPIRCSKARCRSARSSAHAVKDEAPAIAVTDTNNLFGALEFAQKAVKEGIQPIIGCQLDVAFGDENQDANAAIRRQRPELLAAGADRRHRGRLRQSGAAGQPRLSRKRRRARRCMCRSTGSRSLRKA